MSLNAKIVDNVVVINLTGRLNVFLSAEIDKEINDIISKEADKHLLLNLKDVEYMNSSAVGVVMSIAKTLKETERSLKLCNINYSVGKMFIVLNLMDIFDIYESEEKAIASFNKSA